MNNLYKHLPAKSRVWIYQSENELSEDQTKKLNELTDTFLHNWDSHGSPVKGNINLIYNRFITVTIDESDDKVCGGSVDKLGRFMKELESELHISLLDRTQVAYRKGNQIKSCTMHEFERLAKQGEVGKETIVFNNTVHTLAAFEIEWEVPAEKSWHNRLLI